MLIMAAAFTTAGMSARTIEIKMSQCPKPIADYVNKTVKSLSHNDHVILNFDKAGTYEVDGTIHIECSTTIKGLGPNSTKVVIKEGRFANGKSKMLDDCFFGISNGTPSGTTKNKIQFEMRDISFETATHKGIWWEDAEKLLVKVYDANKLTVDNVVYYTRDATITHLDLRDCSNVLVQNCTFENYNNTITGGCLWSRGAQHNVVIRNNIFKKYGNDEALAMWGGNHDYVSEMRDIIVENNEFIYENKTKCKKDYPIHVFISFMHSEDDHIKNECIVDNLYFRNNTITMNANFYCNLRLIFDKLAKIGTFKISGNEFINTSKCSKSSGYMTDINIKAGGQGDLPIVVKENYVRSDCEVLSDGTNSGYTFASVSEANVLFESNIIDSRYPVALLWGHGGNIDVTFDGNTASTLCKTAILSDQTFIKKAKIKAVNNELSGDTRIYCNNIGEIDLDFKNNTFNSNNYHFFLQESAPIGSVIFENNTVNALTGNGVMFANYSGKKCSFSQVKISNNTFNGISKQGIDRVFPNVKKMSSSGNIYIK